MNTAAPKPPAIRQVEDVLRRARKLPIGQSRNDLRQFAKALLKLHRAGVKIEVEESRLRQ